MSEELNSLRSVGVRIKEERTRLRLSVGEFAIATGVSERSQRNYENGERLPDVEYLARAKRLAIDVDYVLTGERSKWESVEAEIEKQCERVEAVVGTFEAALKDQGISLTPEHKARCIRWLYRSSAYGAPLTPEVVNEFLATLG